MRVTRRGWLLGALLSFGCAAPSIPEGAVPPDQALPRAPMSSHLRWLALAPVDTVAMIKISPEAVARSPYARRFALDVQVARELAVGIHLADDAELGVSGIRALADSEDVVLGLAVSERDPLGGSMFSIIAGADPAALAPALHEADPAGWQESGAGLRSDDAVAIASSDLGWVIGEPAQRDELTEVAAGRLRDAEGLPATGRALAERLAIGDAAAVGMVWIDTGLREWVTRHMVQAGFEASIVDRVRGLGMRVDLDDAVVVELVGIAGSHEDALWVARDFLEVVDQASRSPAAEVLGLRPALQAATGVATGKAAVVEIRIEPDVVWQALEIIRQLAGTETPPSSSHA